MEVRETTGLRESKRRAAIARIQLAALDLFDLHGYTAVSVEAVAAAAGVAPRTVYRYFGTKAGILLTQPEDDDVLAALVDDVARRDVLDAVRDLIPMMNAPAFADPDAYWGRVVRYVLAEPELVGAMRVAAVAAADAIAASQAVARGLPAHDLRTRVRARAVIAALMVALEHAYTHSEDLATTVERALETVARLDRPADEESPSDPAGL